MARHAVIIDERRMRNPGPSAGRKSLVRQPLLYSRNTIRIFGAGGRQFSLEFDFPLSQNEFSSLNREIQKWQKSAYPLKTALVLAGVFPGRVTCISDGHLQESDPSAIMGRSFIQGRARDFIYNGCGLEPRTIAALETALYLNSKNRKYDGYNYFRRELSDTQRALADIIFSRLTISKSPVNGAFEADARDIQTIKNDMLEMQRQRSEYSRSTSPQDWNVALISTFRGDYYIRIPKSLASEDHFRRAIEAGKYPDELALIFGLGHVPDLMVQRSRGFPLKPISPNDWNTVNSLPRSELRYYIIGQRRSDTTF